MTRPLLVKLLFAAFFFYVALSTASAATWVEVGDPMNAIDTRVMLSDSTTGYGRVDYVYSIGAYEVTNAEYVDFLNDVASTDTYGLFNPLMESSTRGGITRRIGLGGGYTYSVKPAATGAAFGGTDYTYDNKPVNFVSWYDAVRFANWMTSGDTENGGYTITGGAPDSGVVSIPDDVDRTLLANALTPVVLLPNEDEWYKAAYYQGPPGKTSYFDYPTTSNVEPNNFLPSADVGNSTATDISFWPAPASDAYPFVDVGSYTLSDSHYGTFDQGGNAYEWTDTVVGTDRVRRGGTSGLSASQTGSNIRALEDPNPIPMALSGQGFRVVRLGHVETVVPEPTAAMLLSLFAGGMLVHKRGR